MKDFSVYDLETKKHYPEGKMEITHEDWVFLRELDGFIPETYKRITVCPVGDRRIALLVHCV